MIKINQKKAYHLIGGTLITFYQTVGEKHMKQEEESNIKRDKKDCTLCTCASNRLVRNVGLVTGALIFGLMTIFNS